MIFPFDQELENQRYSINHNITDKLRTTKNACNDFKSAAGDGCSIYQLMRGDKIRKKNFGEFPVCCLNVMQLKNNMKLELQRLKNILQFFYLPQLPRKEDQFHSLLDTAIIKTNVHVFLILFFTFLVVVKLWKLLFEPLSHVVSSFDS